MTATLTRSPGWDSTMRKVVRLRYGSMRAAAEHLSIDTSDIGYERSHGMRVWSRMVQTYGSTDALLHALDIESNCPRCGSPQPHLHPAVQFEGEVQVCPHPWHRE